MFHIAQVEDQRVLNNYNVSNAISTELSTASANSQQRIGECVTEVTYGNCSTLQAENFTWYLNNSRLDYDVQNNSIFDYQEDSGILDILTNKAAENYIGLYLCVTTFPGGVGSFVTAARNLVPIQVTNTSKLFTLQ